MTHSYKTYDAKDLSLLSFETDKDYAVFISLYRERRRGRYLSQFGHLKAIVPKEDFSGLRSELIKIASFREDPVRSIRELGPEKAGALRRNRGKPKLADAQEQKYLETLADRHGIKLP